MSLFAQVLAAGYTVRKVNESGAQQIHQIFNGKQIQPVGTVLVKKGVIAQIRARVDGGTMPVANFTTLLNVLREHKL